jgi:hypothetical protein
MVVGCDAHPGAVTFSCPPVPVRCGATAVELPPVFRRPHTVGGLSRIPVVAASKGSEATAGVSPPILGRSLRRVAESLSAVSVISAAEPAETVAGVPQQSGDVEQLPSILSFLKVIAKEPADRKLQLLRDTSLGLQIVFNSGTCLSESCSMLVL